MHKLQQVFKKSILHHGNSKLLSIITQNDIYIKEYINLCQDNFYGILINSLSTTYPTIKKLIGEKCFDYLAKLYVKSNYHKSNSLKNYGKKFSSFINSKVELKSFPYLYHVAKLDYYLYLVRNANTDYKININSDNIYYFNDFKLKKYIKLVKSKYPIDFIFKFCNSKKHVDKSIEVPKRGSNLLILKINNVVKYLCLNNFDYNFLLDFKRYNKLSNMQEIYDLEDDIKVQKILSKILQLDLLTF
ncbi:putative DNA-binding domain-containing protein [Candidatus Aquarickettsia rohweri]|uniref:DUF2063 domain-containing protein n=1 Tax=Candidatus Aquarickettsia rohweri TaxID=2602574 RepID=A0A429XSG5_9RICK|nr:putative DNA-binding domain-containing protein [Candidatus Aquarickettsia rohweri]RST70021.1 DUF2063 domain-containing protein [Candidatus Aquarickettsia rohweri]